MLPHNHEGVVAFAKYRMSDCYRFIFLSEYRCRSPPPLLEISIHKFQENRRNDYVLLRH